MGQDGQGVPRPRFFHQAGAVLLACRVVAEKPDGGGGERPCAGGLAHLRAGGAVARAGGFCGTRDQPAGGDALLASGEAGARVELIPPHQRQDLAAPWEGTQAGEGRRRVRRGGLDESPRQGREHASGGVDQRAVHLETLLDGGLENALGHAGPVRLVGELLAARWAGVWAGGLVAMRQARGPLAQELPPAPEQGPRGPPLGGRDLRLGQPPAAQEPRARVGIERSGFGRAPREGLQVEGVAQHEGHPCLGAAVGQPGPR
jgi:hypothetical protein